MKRGRLLAGDRRDGAERAAEFRFRDIPRRLARESLNFDRFFAARRNLQLQDARLRRECHRVRHHRFSWREVLEQHREHPECVRVFRQLDRSRIDLTFAFATLLRLDPVPAALAIEPGLDVAREARTVLNRPITQHAPHTVLCQLERLV